MAVGFSNTNKPINPRGQDASPLAYNRAKLYSGKALDFDGVNDKVNITTDDIDLQEFSVVQYVNLGTTAASKIFYSNYASTGNLGFATGISDSTANVPKFYTKGTSSDTLFGSFALNAGEWYQIVATYDGAIKKLYVNGILDTEVAFSDTILYTNATNQIGALSGGTAQALDGQLSNVKVYSTALTAAQVADLYNNPEKVVPTGVDNTALKLWLPMMEGAGTTAYDGSGNGNHGTISGATYVNGIGAPVAQSAVIDWNKGSNKILYSEEFDNAYYTANTVSKSANETTAPDGQTTADKITGILANDHYIYNTSIALTGQNTISVFAKYNGYNIGLRPQGIGSGQAFANFNLQNGTILGSGGTYYNDSSITSFGNGWYRCSLTLTYPTPYGFGIYVVNGTTATELPSFTADGTSGFYLWGAQATAGATLTPYVRTGATAQTSEVLLPQGLTTGRDITGVNLFETVRKQGALNLDGNSWAEVHDNESLDITDEVTLEAWVYWDAGSDNGIMGRWDYNVNKKCYLLYQSSSNLVRFYISSNGSTDTNIANSITNGWRHIIGTDDGTTIRLYIDGAEVGNTASLGSIFASDENLKIGTFVLESQRYPYDIAQPRIYNRALTASEVLRNYNSGKNTYK
jgi:hypothetical protein